MLLCGLSSSVFSQNLFDINTIRTININFYDTNWDPILDSLASLNLGTGSGTQRILADVIIDGIQFDSCGVRYKGNSSMDTASNKNPFNIDLNYTISGQEYMGKDKIKLANCYTDPSMVREALSYEIANEYMDAPHGNFVKLSINGNYIGVYTNTESVDNEFLDTYYGSSGNPFFKCDPTSFELYGDNSNLAYHADPAVYDTLYDMKSTFGVTELQQLTYDLEFNMANIEDHLDVDRVLWFLALSSILVHNDGYTAFGHNYYVYQMDNGKWSIVLWDVNMSFGGLLWNGTNLLPLGLTALQQQDPYLHESAFNFRPLIARILSEPKYKRQYTAHFKTIQQEYISNGLYLQRAEFMSNLISNDVQAESYNSYTHQQFLDNLYTNVGFWFDYRPGLQQLMDPRNVYLNGITEFQETQPTISNILVSNGTPAPLTTVTITAQLTDETSAELGYRHSKFEPFTKVPMFDDGTHNDGAANDGVYGADVTVQFTEMQYYVVAENLTAASFSPVRAEYEFYTLHPTQALVINEFSAVNTTIAADQDGEYDDWIELYNNTNATIDLAGYFLSDDPSDLTKWVFPTASIGPGAYLIIWADDDLWQTGLHANFQLNGVGEILSLSDANGVLVNQIEYSAQDEDITYGRYPNGVGNFQVMNPTFNAQNSGFLGVEDLLIETPSLEVFPNPADEFVFIRLNNIASETIQVVDFTGKVVFETKKGIEKDLLIPTGNLTAGMYLIKTQSGLTKRIIIR